MVWWSRREDLRSEVCMARAGMWKGAVMSGGPRTSWGAGIMRLHSAICTWAVVIGMVVFLGPMMPVLMMGIGAEICK